MFLGLIKVANRVFDIIVSFLGLFGLKIRQSIQWHHQGVCFIELNHKGHVEQIPDFEVHDSDIFLATYPRSGTHLTAEIIDGILDNGDTTRLRKIHQCFRSPFIEVGHPYAFVPVLHILSLFGVIQRGSKDISRYFKTRSPPRVFKTHMPVRLVPKQLLAGKGKLIYVVRNPLDTMISYWKLFSSMTTLRFTNSFDEYHEAFLSGDVYYGSWFDHVTSYWQIRENKNIFFLKFEDIKSDIREVIRRLAEFLERGPLSDETVEKIANHCSLKNMKGNEMANPDVLYPSSIIAKRKEGGFIRKGVVGGWKNQLTEEQAEKIKQKYREKVASQGLILELDGSI